jgi:hypothetical protein
MDTVREAAIQECIRKYDAIFNTSATGTLGKNKVSGKMFVKPARISDEFLNEVYAFIQDLWRKSLIVFVNETAALIKIETGMSRASLIPLSKYLGNNPALIVRSDKVRRDLHDMSGRAVGGWRDKAEGIAAGEAAFMVDYGSPSSPKLSFTFDINVWQWHLRENGYAMKQGSGWHSLEIGVQKMQKYMDTEYESFISRLVRRQLVTRLEIS